MNLVTKDSSPESGPAALFRGLSDSLRGLFGKGSDPAGQFVGLAILTYILNPFNIVPRVRPGFFDGIRRFSDYMGSAYRGGLFRRGDE